ncbi:MAG: FAD-dependent monooxygenase [Planctomycetota bacterium]|nr:FAD-dependent monooxygenase [Planctomycetota bacterium]
MTVRATDLPSQAPDVLIVGAGPAGTVAAAMLAARGIPALLVDRAAFPRSKVCGCCLSDRAIAALESVDLAACLRDLDPPELRRLRVFDSTGVHAEFAITPGWALSRDAMDAALAREACRRGAMFLDACSARIHADLSVSLTRGGTSTRVRTRAIIAADGIAGSSLQKVDPMAWRVSSAPRIGMSCVLDLADGSRTIQVGPGERAPGVDGSFHGLPGAKAGAERAESRGVIRMGVLREGYAGVTDLASGLCVVAAAIRPEFVRASGGPGEAVAKVLASDEPELARLARSAAWKGAPALTRSRESLECHVGGTSLFVAGDAAGYVEPFTGEGMSWAIDAAIAVVPFVERALITRDVQGSTFLPGAWTAHAKRLFRLRHARCRTLSLALRSPLGVHSTLRVASRVPRVASTLAAAFGRQPTGSRQRISTGAMA